MSSRDRCWLVLEQAVSVLLPSATKVHTRITEHVWRDRRYVGEYKGRVAAWRGWKVNLTKVDNRFRTLYIDQVHNVLGTDDRIRLFGPDFAQAINGLSSFVVMFTTLIPLDAIDEIRQNGFVPRTLPRRVHACLVVSPEEFAANAPTVWGRVMAQMAVLQSHFNRPKGQRRSNR